MAQHGTTLGLSGLPVEIMEYVVEYLLEGQQDGSLAALAATCRGLHALVMPRLYSKEAMEKHPALIFWATQLGRFETAKRLVDAGVDLNRGMIRNETMAHLRSRTATLTPGQLYQDLRVICHGISPHDTLPRVGPRGFIGETFKPRIPGFRVDWGGGASPSARSWWFPLHLAVAGGHRDLIDLFVSNGAILDVPSGYFCTCRYPVLAAAQPAYRNRRTMTPLHTAICIGQTTVAKALLERGASLSFGENSKRIPHPVMALHQAASTGSTDLVEYLLDNNYHTDVSVVDSSELSPLWLAYIQGHWDVVDMLVARGADINDDLAAGYTPLIDACLFGEFSSALELIARGADVNVVCTAYPVAISRYRYETAKSILTCLRGHRPIDLCCMKQQACTRSLRYRRNSPNPRYGAHEAMNPPPPSEPTPLVDESLRTPVVQALLDAGADLGPCEQSPSLVPPIVSAAAEHLVSVVRLLLDRGAGVDSCDKNGNTALMAALNYSLHWCSSHARDGPLSTRPFGLQRPPRTPPAPAQPVAVIPGNPPPGFGAPPPGLPPQTVLAAHPPTPAHPPLPGIPVNIVHIAPPAHLPPPGHLPVPVHDAQPPQPLPANPPPAIHPQLAQVIHPLPPVNPPPAPAQQMVHPPPAAQPHAPPPHVLIQNGNHPLQLGPPYPVIINFGPPRPKPPGCRLKGDFTECVKLLIERGADSKARNDSGATALSLVYSPPPPQGLQYASNRPRGFLTFKERAVVVSMLLDLGADPNTKVDIAHPDESNSDIDSDDPNVYSASDSEDSLDTAIVSDDSSSVASFRPPRRRRFRSLYSYGPLSVLQCAFWDGDLDACRSLLARGAELTTPIVAWMLHLAWGYCRWRMRDAADRVLQILGDLEVSRQTELGSHPACLYVLITQGVRHMAAELLELGIERSKFDSVPGKEYTWLFGEKTTATSKTWGDLCLLQAVRTGWLAGIEPLLQLGLGVDSPSLEPAKTPLALAISRRDSAMVSHLVRHGASVHLADESEVVRFKRKQDRRYPLVMAIRTEEQDIISALLRERKEPLPARFAFAYVREAYMARRAKALACLLGFTSVIDVNTRASGTNNTHLVEVLSNVSAVCTHQPRSPVGSSDDSDNNDDDDAPGRMWSYSIKMKLEKVRVWIDCLILLARAGVSASEKNEAGRSAIDLFEELVNYKGPDRFKVHVRSALRSRLNEVLGLTVWDDSLSGEAAFEALAKCETVLEDRDSGSSGSDATFDD